MFAYFKFVAVSKSVHIFFKNLFIVSKQILVFTIAPLFYFSDFFYRLGPQTVEIGPKTTAGLNVRSSRAARVPARHGMCLRRVWLGCVMPAHLGQVGPCRADPSSEFSSVSRDSKLSQVSNTQYHDHPNGCIGC